MVPFAGYSMPLAYGDVGQGGPLRCLIVILLNKHAQLQVITTSEKASVYLMWDTWSSPGEDLTFYSACRKRLIIFAKFSRTNRH